MDTLLFDKFSPSFHMTGLEQSGSEIFPYPVRSKELASVLLFLSSHVGVDSFLSNISLGSSYGWYFKVTQFELIFLGLIMLQLCVLRYVEILPLNLNNLFLGDPSGKRRRRGLEVCRKDEMSESMLKILKKLDDGECLPFLLCQLQALSHSHVAHPSMDYELPKETKLLLSSLKRLKKNRKKSGNCEVSENMADFEEAVDLGSSKDNRYLNSTVCQARYHSCPMNSEDIVQYVGTIVKGNMI